MSLDAAPASGTADSFLPLSNQQLVYSFPNCVSCRLNGHQIVCHWVGDDYRCDGDEVPVPHSGLALTVEEFHEMADRVRAAGIPFIIEPHLRFEGMPGEQYTMFFKDPSGNNLEFKGTCIYSLSVNHQARAGPVPITHIVSLFLRILLAAMTRPENLFAKYNVADK
jgi:extradiol dioxygenase family protein